MKFGVASIFSFRPHVEHMAYLAVLLEQAGHEIHGFTCDAALSHCYSRDLRGRPRVTHCAGCMIGGIRSFALPRIWSVKPRLRASLDESRLARLTVSSIATRFRTESAAELAIPELRAAQQQLYGSMEVVYGNAKRWIEARGLEAVLLFNGRMDMTAALAAACEDCGIPYVSVERSWFGHGLLLNPDQNCLGLREIKRLSRQFRDTPLLPDQARYAGRIAADRFRQRNTLEWRLYNVNAQSGAWPGPSGATRVAILPSSKNEVEGHPDYHSHWSDHTEAMGLLLSRLKLDPRWCVLRCHPNWSEHVGLNTGWRSERLYTDWGQKLGMTVISSAQRVNTYALIEQADLVIVNASSTGVEAGLRGKPVVGIGHAPYEDAGFSVHIQDDSSWGLLEELKQHDPERTIRRTLRYLYTYGRRFTQFEDYVRAQTTLRYEYLCGADASRLVRMCQNRQLAADDPASGTDDESETAIVRLVAQGDWEELGKWEQAPIGSPRLQVRRRFGLRWVDHVRSMLPRGDL
jgi:hypothetical protein